MCRAQFEMNPASESEALLEKRSGSTVCLCCFVVAASVDGTHIHTHTAGILQRENEMMQLRYSSSVVLRDSLVRDHHRKPLVKG